MTTSPPGRAVPSQEVRSKTPFSVSPHPFEDSDTPEVFEPLSPQEAAALRAKLVQVSPWRVLGLQMVVGLVCALVSALMPWPPSVAWSALYGAAAVVVPGALMARGMTRQRPRHAGAALLAFAWWEGLKILLTVALLAAAVKVVPHLNWPALLVTMVVCLKTNWLAMLWWQRGPVSKYP